MRDGRSAAVGAAAVTGGSDGVALAARGPGEPGTVPGVLGPAGAEVVPCASLRAADSPRLAGESVDHIAALAEAGGRWPPIVVHRQSMRVIDGMHRLRAAQLRGDRGVPVTFFDGDADEAFIAAVRANITHGLPLTLADRKAAAERILGCQPHRSDRWVGEATGLAAGTVAAIRRRAGTAGLQAPSRLGRDGRVRPLDAADGRLRAQQEISARPGASLRQIANAAGISPATAKDVRDRLRRGDDPVPPAERQDRTGKQAGASRPAVNGSRPAVNGSRPAVNGSRTGANGSGTGTSPGINERGPDWSLQRLMRDPSLRYSEPGRRLLRTLDLHARGPSAVEELIDAVPAHCGYLVAKLARQCARRWTDLADALERAPRIK